MSPKAIAGVLLDIDDTLVDTRGAFRHALKTVADLYLPGGFDVEEMTAHWRTDASGWYRAHARGEMTHREQRMRRANELHEAFGGPVLDEVGYDEWDGHFEVAFRAGWSAHDDAAPLIGLLDRAGIEFGALSNADSTYQAMKLAAVGLGDVPMLVGTDTLGFGKPHPEVFLEGARRLGLHPRCVAYIGDERDIDAAAALEAGLGMGIWLDRPGGHPQPGPIPAGVTRATSLDEVARILHLNH